MLSLIPWVFFGASMCVLIGVGVILSHHFMMYSKSVTVTAGTVIVYTTGSFLLLFALFLVLL